MTNGLTRLSPVEDLVLAGSDPVEIFLQIFEVAKKECKFTDPEAMALATFDPHSQSPDLRFVLYKGVHKGKLTFCTNYKSPKGRQLSNFPHASAAFYWREIHTQVRWKGHVERAPSDFSDLYWESRPWQSRISSALSEQSSILPNRKTLEEAYLQGLKAGPDAAPPRPESWGAFFIVPHCIEFWMAHEHRLHRRLEFRKDPGIQNEWSRVELSP